MPSELTEQGLAATFYISNETPFFEPILNLRNRKFMEDCTPILANCACYTCQNHTKAYVQHLLNANEMLAESLLQMHNIFHYLRFFKEIRNQIEKGTFLAYKAHWLNKKSQQN